MNTRQVIFKDLDNVEYEFDESQSQIVRVGCYGLVKNENNEYLMIVTNKNKGWEFPGGGCDFREILSNCVIREVREESGYDVKLVQEQPIYVVENFAYSRRRNEYWKKIDFLYLCERISTTQHNLVLEEGEEILEMRWMSIEEMKTTLWIHYIEEHKAAILNKLI
ncbi:MAG: NUDIX hydrolase [Candidatus Nanoarchaeia archaeon]